MSNAGSPNMNFRSTIEVQRDSSERHGEKKKKDRVNGGLKAFFSRRKKNSALSDNSEFSSRSGSLNKSVRPDDVIKSLSRSDKSADFRLQVVESVGRSTSLTIPTKKAAPQPPPIIKSFSRTDHQIALAGSLKHISPSLKELNNDKKHDSPMKLELHQEIDESEFHEDVKLDRNQNLDGNDKSLSNFLKLEGDSSDDKEEFDDIKVTALVESLISHESFQQDDADSRRQSVHSNIAMFVAPPPPTTPPSSDIPMAPPPWELYANESSYSMTLDLEDKNVGVSSPDFETARKGGSMFLLADNVDNEEWENTRFDEVSPRHAISVESKSISSELCTVEELHADLDEMITMADKHLTLEDASYNLEVSQFVKRMEEMTSAYHNMQEINDTTNIDAIHPEDQNKNRRVKSIQFSKASSCIEFQDGDSEELVELELKPKSYEARSIVSNKEDISSFTKFQDGDSKEIVELELKPKSYEARSIVSNKEDNSSFIKFQDGDSEEIIGMTQKNQRSQRSSEANEEYDKLLDLNTFFSTKDEFVASIYLRNAPYYNEISLDNESISSVKTEEIEDKIKNKEGLHDRNFLILQIEELEVQLEILRNQLNRNQELLIISRLNQIQSLSASNCVFHQQIILQRQMITQLEASLAILHSQLNAPTEPILVYSDKKISATTPSKNQKSSSPQSPVMLRSTRSKDFDDLKYNFLKEYKELSVRQLPHYAEELRHTSREEAWSKTSKLQLSLSNDYENESTYLFAENVQVKDLPFHSVEDNSNSSQNLKISSAGSNLDQQCETDFNFFLNQNFTNSENSSTKERWRSHLTEQCEEEFQLSVEILKDNRSMKYDLNSQNCSPLLTIGNLQIIEQQPNFDEANPDLTQTDEDCSIKGSDSTVSNVHDLSYKEFNRLQLDSTRSSIPSHEASSFTLYEQFQSVNSSNNLDSKSSIKDNPIYQPNSKPLAMSRNSPEVASNFNSMHQAQPQLDEQFSNSLSANEDILSNQHGFTLIKPKFQALNHLNYWPQQSSDFNHQSRPEPFAYSPLADESISSRGSYSDKSDYALSHSKPSSMTEHWSADAPNLSNIQNFRLQEDEISAKSKRLSKSTFLNQTNITDENTLLKAKEQFSRWNSSNQFDSTPPTTRYSSEVSKNSTFNQPLERNSIISLKWNERNSEINNSTLKTLQRSQFASNCSFSQQFEPASYHKSLTTPTRSNVNNLSRSSILSKINISPDETSNSKMEDSSTRYFQHYDAKLSNEVRLKSRHSFAFAPKQHEKEFDEVSVKENEQKESIPARWSWSNQAHLNRQNVKPSNCRPTRHSEVVNYYFNSDKHFDWSQSIRRSIPEKNGKVFNNLASGKSLPFQSKELLLSKECVSSTTVPPLEDDLPKVGTVSQLMAVFSGTTFKATELNEHLLINSKQSTSAMRSTSEPPHYKNENISREQPLFY